MLSARCFLLVLVCVLLLSFFAVGAFEVIGHMSKHALISASAQFSYLPFDRMILFND